MLPKVVLHNAVSVDGRIDGFSVDLGLFYGLASRWGEDATLVGSETVLAADTGSAEEAEQEAPAPAPGDRRPLLVIPDSRGRVHTWNALRRQPYWKDAVCVCSRSTPRDYLEYLSERKVDCVVSGEDHVDLRAALQELNARYGVRLVRVDSGGVLNGALLRDGLVDEVSVLISPSLVGGTTPRSLFRSPDLLPGEGAIQLRLAGVEQMAGDTVWLRYEVVK